MPPRTLFPLLEGATLEDEEDLHRRWLALLVNTARIDYDKEVLPYFPDILKQLTSEEARFLDAAYDEMTTGAEQRQTDIRASNPHLGGSQTFDLGTSGKLIGSIHPIAIDNLERLRLVTRNRGGLSLDNKIVFATAGGNHLYVSDLGQAFVVACRLPK